MGGSIFLRFDLHIFTYSDLFRLHYFEAFFSIVIASKKKGASCNEQEADF